MFESGRGYLLPFVLLFIAISAVLLYPVPCLEVRGLRSSERLLLRKVSPGDQFEFHYIHSVDGNPVSGSFVVTSRHTIKPIETCFLSYAPGLPSTEGKVVRERGKIVARIEAEEMRAFSFFVSPMVRPSLKFKEESLDLSLLREGEVVSVEVKKHPIGRTLFRYGRE